MASIVHSNHRRVLLTLGVTQILSWGTLFYSIAVTSKSLQKELQLPEAAIIGAFSAGLLIAGAIAPYIGLWIDRNGGRRPFVVGSILAAASFGILAICEGVIIYFVGWAVAGLAMALCLYDPAFVLLHQLMPERYRRAVIVLTLFGGFASTLFWPITHWLLEGIGWRKMYWVFALCHIIIAAPLHYFCLPGKLKTLNRSKTFERRPPSISPVQRRIIRWLAISFTAATAIFAVLSVFIIDALEQTGFTRTDAVTLASLIGPLQVAGRLLEWRLADRMSALMTGAIALAMLLLATVLLNLMTNAWGVAIIFIALYGISNGIMTVARGAVPVELLGEIDAGAVFGILARPVFLSQACTPAMFSVVLSYGYSLQQALWVIVLFAVIAMVFYIKTLFSQLKFHH